MKRLDDKTECPNWFLVVESENKRLAIELHDTSNDKPYPYESGEIDDKDLHVLMQFFMDYIQTRGSAS